VMVIRHAEKPPSKDNHHLSSVGLARAQKLVSLFLPRPPKAGLAVPDRIVVSQGKSASWRPYETGQPLATALGLTLDNHWDAAHGKDAGKAIAGLTGTTLVIWAHGEIPDVVGALVKAKGSCSPKPPKVWSDARYDVVWVFDEAPDGKSWKFTQVPQMLMPGDKDTAIKASPLAVAGRWLRRAVGA